MEQEGCGEDKLQRGPGVSRGGGQASARQRAAQRGGRDLRASQQAWGGGPKCTFSTAHESGREETKKVK